MRRRHVLLLAGGGAVLVALAFVVGFLFAGGLARDRDPPCEDTESGTPDGDGCVSNDEVCNAYGRVVDAQTVACSVRSPEGRGTLRPVLAGVGRVDVTVTDGSGAVVWQQAYSLAAGSPGDIPLSGKPGTWRLQVRFTEVRGDVKVILWG